MPILDAAAEEDSSVPGDESAAVVVPRIAQYGLPPSEAATAAAAHEEGFAVRNDKFAAIVVPRVIGYHHSTLEGAAADMSDPQV